MTRTRTQHGIIALPPDESARLVRAYAIHQSNAIVARASENRELARHHAAKTRALVTDFAKYPPFSPDSGLIYLRGGR